MKLSLFAYTRRGCETARRVLRAFPRAEAAAYTAERLAGNGFLAIAQPSSPFYGERFRASDALVFVGACGIAVRAIAPHVRSKTEDPAVLCVDEAGRFVIPLLSGHIGGANALARTLAVELGAVAAVTTATDVNRRFSVDQWAAENGYVIDDMAAAKQISAAILEGGVPFCSDLPVVTKLPPGLVRGETGPLGIYIGWETGRQPFDTTLRLVPRALRLGLGCRRGTDAKALREAVETVFAAQGIDLRAVVRAASIDLKRDEPGLLEYCRGRGWPLDFYTPEQLRAVDGALVTPSAFVRNVTGVDNVCERAALLGAERLIIKKTAIGGVTVAAAAGKAEVRFG